MVFAHLAKRKTILTELVCSVISLSRKTIIVLDDIKNEDIVEEIHDLIKKIPQVFQSNAMKSIDRLVSSIIDVPTAYLEGISKEKRAETEGRVKLKQKSTFQLARQMKVPKEYVQVASKKFAHQVVREQINLDTIVKNTLIELGSTSQQSDLSSSKSADTTKKNINDDWLNSFEKEAKQKSTEEMQKLFGRILSGEIKQPGSFSIKAIKVLSELDATVACLFQKLCSYAIYLPQYRENTVVSSLGGQASQNALKKFGFRFSELNTLNEYGLITSDFNSWCDFTTCVWDKDKAFLYPKRRELYMYNSHQLERKGINWPFQHLNHEWILKPTQERDKSMDVHISGILFSKVGRELLSIVDLMPEGEYTKELKKYFLKQYNLEMVSYSEIINSALKFQK